MIKMLARRLFTSILIWLFMCWLCMWMIDVIPGQYQDFYIDETNNNTQTTTIEEEEITPLFYFGFIPDRESETFPFPEFKWHGTNNRYHDQIAHFLRGDFGLSYKDNRPVKEILKERLRWSVALQFPALCIIILLSFWLAWNIVLRQKSGIWKYVKESLLLVHAVPSFWLGAVLLLLFATPDFLNWFPAQAHAIEADDVWEIWVYYPAYLILPVIGLVLPSLSFLSRLLENGFLEARSRAHWKKAIAIGMDENTAMRTQGLPWAMIPFLSWFAGVLPWMFSGALVIENIFSIPGIGRALLQSILLRDWPISTAIFLLISAATMLGFLVADIALMLIDSRTKNDKA
jgi:peptide/nickel transport system permease protein